MIHFHLLCDAAHEFDGWFRSGEDFDRQGAAGLISCPFCGSTKIHKALMAPAIATSRKVPTSASATAPQAELPQGRAPQEKPVSLALSERERAFLHAWRQVAEKIRQTADYVGSDFAEEARKIHFGESKSRAIYGEAQRGEISSLLEDGIEVMPLPPLPEKQN